MKQAALPDALAHKRNDLLRPSKKLGISNDTKYSSLTVEHLGSV